MVGLTPIFLVKSHENLGGTGDTHGHYVLESPLGDVLVLSVLLFKTQLLELVIELPHILQGPYRGTELRAYSKSYSG